MMLITTNTTYFIIVMVESMSNIGNILQLNQIEY